MGMISTNNMESRRRNFCCGCVPAYPPNPRMGLLRTSPPDPGRQLLRLPAHARLGGLRVDSRDALLKGGKSPDRRSCRAIRRKACSSGRCGRPSEKLKMPQGRQAQGGRRSAALEEWVKAARRGRRRKSAPSPQTGYVILYPISRFFVPAFETPAESANAWAKTEIDRFVLAALEKQGMKPVSRGHRAR